MMGVDEVDKVDDLINFINLYQHFETASFIFARLSKILDYQH
jgi:hypothetical protein